MSMTDEGKGKTQLHHNLLDANVVHTALFHKER